VVGVGVVGLLQKDLKTYRNLALGEKVWLIAVVAVYFLHSPEFSGSPAVAV
jgi:hypothetical protein